MTSETTRPADATEGAWDAGDVRVLVVEDEIRQAAALKRGLEAEGFAVDVAANGTDGLWLATEQPYDVIVLDVMLPGLNGYKVCAELRAREVWTPVLMLTAKDGELDEAEALDTGADDFLSKPFSYLVLVARLRALLRRGAAARPAVLRVGGLELDVGARRATLDGEVVDLTPREFAIVEYLMRRHGEVVPKADILGHVWDFAFDGDDNVVEVHISALRRKLGPATIETVRGAGYRIVARGRA
jgi:DNA-binding response OmpR family regulator